MEPKALHHTLRQVFLMLDYFRDLDKKLEKKFHDFFYTPTQSRFHVLMFVKILVFMLFGIWIGLMPVRSQQDIIWIIVGLTTMAIVIFFGFKIKRPHSNKRRKKSNFHLN